MNVESLYAELMQICVPLIINDETVKDYMPMVGQNLKVDLMQDFSGRVVASFRSFILNSPGGSETVTVSTYPNWWEHFKDTVFPWWLKERVRITKYTDTYFRKQNVYVCPHSDMKWDNRTARVHLSFINTETERSGQ